MVKTKQVEGMVRSKLGSLAYSLAIKEQGSPEEDELLTYVRNISWNLASYTEPAWFLFRPDALHRHVQRADCGGVLRSGPYPIQKDQHPCGRRIR